MMSLVCDEQEGREAVNIFHISRVFSVQFKAHYWQCCWHAGLVYSIHMGRERERLCSMILHALDPNAGIVIMTGREIVCYGFFLEIDTGIVVGRG